MAIDKFYNFRYVWLNSGEIVHLQSRGLSLEAIGYLPVSIRSNNPTDTNVFTDWIESGNDDLLNFGNLIRDYKISGGGSADGKKLDKFTFIMPGLKYKSNGSYLTPNPVSTYSNYLSNYQDHMFTDLRSTASTEMKFSAYSDDPRVGGEQLNEVSESQSIAPGGSIQLSFDINNEMFGDKIDNTFYIDAIVIFGQAYNRRSKDDTAQGNLQKVVPIGLLVYTGDRSASGDDSLKYRPFIDPKALEGVVLRETLAISLLQGSFNIDAITDTAAFSAWSGFASTMHLVNDGATTTGKYFLNDNSVDIKPYSASDSNTTLGDLSADGTYVMRERLFFGENSDTRDINNDFASPASMTIMRKEDPGTKNPQILIGKTSLDDETLVNFWDGVTDTYWQEQTDENSGSIYSKDWISKTRPGFNIFCQDIENEYKNPALGPVGSAVFGGGINMFSNSCFAGKYSNNLFSENNILTRDSTSINSRNITVLNSGGNTPDSKSNKNNRSVNNLFLNSKDVEINNPQNLPGQIVTIIGSEQITTHDNNTVTKTNPLTRRLGALCSQQAFVRDSDKVLFLNVKGSKSNNSWLRTDIYSSNNITVIGGRAQVNYAERCTLIGKDNVIYGQSDQMSKNSIVIGNNNFLKTIGTKFGSQHNIIVLGNGLENDPKQQIFERSMDPSKTLLLGENNNVYTQITKKGSSTLKGSSALISKDWTDYTNVSIYPSSIKQIVVGGWKPKSTDKRIARYNMAEFSVDNTSTNETSLTMNDIQGRTIDYTSRGINVAVMENLSQENFNKYNYKSLGSINWAKLIRLLDNLQYDQDTGVVTYIKKGPSSSLDTDNLAKYRDVVWDNDDSPVNFYDLVRIDLDNAPAPKNLNLGSSAPRVINIGGGTLIPDIPTPSV